MKLYPTPQHEVSECNEVLVIGLNPAFQSTLHFDRFQLGQVNRAVRKCNSIGGKGQNFAIACWQYGEGGFTNLMLQTR